MAKRATAIEKTIATIDEKIAGLQFAKDHLVQQQKQQGGKRKPRAVTATGTDG